MATYKTKDGSDVIIPGVGKTVDGKITTEFPIESPVLELVDEGQKTVTTDSQEEPDTLKAVEPNTTQPQPEATPQFEYQNAPNPTNEEQA